MDIYVVIPAHNEENTISKVVKESKQHAKVIVVNDGSKDRTATMAKKAGAIVLNHKTNYGYGKSLYDGIKDAMKRGAKFIITLDADGQHEPKDIPKFIRELKKGYGVVIGSRFLGGKQWGSWKRMLALKMLGLQLRIFSGLKLTDAQSGYRGYNSKVFEQVELTDFGMGFSVELPIKAKKKGFSFTEVPIKIKRPHQIKNFSSVFHQGMSVGYAIIRYSLFS